MPWLLLTGLAVAARASLSIATKLVSNRVQASAVTLAALLTGVSTVVAVLLSPLLGGLSLHGLGPVWPVAVGMMASQGFGNVLFFKGVARLDAGMSQIAFSAIVVWSIGLSVLLLGSTFSPVQLAGAALLLGAILLAGWGKVDAGHYVGVLFIVASTAMYALFQVTSAQLSRHVSAGTYLVLAYGGATLLLAALYPRTVRREVGAISRVWRGAAPVVLFSSASSMLHFVFAFYAYRSAPDRGTVVVLLTTQVVLSVLLGIVFLGERRHAGRKVAAGGLAILASWLVYR